jgi:hypothetical protein
MRLSFLKKAAFAFALIGGVVALYGQKRDFPGKMCATLDHPLPWLKAFQEKALFAPHTNEIRYVAVAIHLVGTDKGEQMVQESKILDAFCTLNRHFTGSGIQFYLSGNFRRINRSAFHEHSSGLTGLTMMNLNNVPAAINTYFVKDALDACGYTLRDNSGLGIGIVLTEACIRENSSIWTHEMGHFFSLPHTFQGWERENANYAIPAPASVGNIAVELADGRNCSTAGDGFCDTRADYLNGRWFCGAGSVSQIVQFDPLGNAFRSDGTLFMSYAADPCPVRFSPQQREAMQAHLTSIRIDLMQSARLSPDVTLRNEIQLIWPANTAQVPNFQEVGVSWNSLAGADAYLLEFSFLPSFPFTSNRYLVWDTTVIVRDLRPSQTYFWRVRPFSAQSTCRVFSAVRSFSTGNITDSKEAEHAPQKLELFPNPVRSNQPLSIGVVADQTGQIAFELIDLMGKRLFTTTAEAISGPNTFTFGHTDIAPGTYLLRVWLGGKTISRKFVIGP